MADANDDGFKIMEGIRRCPNTGAVITGKQVIRPVRFFVSEPGLNISHDRHACLLLVVQGYHETDPRIKQC